MQFLVGQRAANNGWRLDYTIVNERLRPAIAEAEILSDVFGSDHCPVSVVLDVPLDETQLS